MYREIGVHGCKFQQGRYWCRRGSTEKGARMLERGDAVMVETKIKWCTKDQWEVGDSKIRVNDER